MLRGFVGMQPFVRVGGEAPMAKATSTSREGFIVGLSFLWTMIWQDLVSPTYSNDDISTVEQYLPTVTRPDVCYFSVTLATHLEKNRGSASRHFSK